MKYHAKEVEVSQGFKRVIFEHIPRTENERADRLSRLATNYYSELLEGLYIEICDQPAYKEEVIKSIAGCNASDWREPIIEYLTQGVLPSDSQEAKKVRKRSSKYQIYQDELYRKSWDRPLLTCVATEDRVVGPNTYELEDLDAKVVPRTWHASKLCKCYV
ncbi:hypothetical protein LIER_35562 [Lithospermum erythrorhizon]|uniref:RNase H type-1 domain-containing protein n=1 Tax=Lithospermum erythrorhizon TaxID=34254 RepID=A0AAV3NSI4_LITER